MNYLKRIALALALTIHCAFVYAQEWTYLGRIDTAYVVNGVQLVASVPPALLVATPWTFMFPGSGGVFRHQGSDTTWQRVGLADRRIMDLEQPVNLPGRLFAPTEIGVYESTDYGTSWNPFPTVSDPVFLPSEFNISPLDSTLWILGSYDDIGEGKLWVTTNSGSSWRLAYYARSHWPVFSRHRAATLYFDGAGYLYRASLTDSSLEAIQTCWELPFLTGIVGHPTEPWIYCAWEDTLLRYDEMTSGRLFHTITPDIMPANSMVGDPQGGLWIGAAHGIYHVSDDMETWEQIESPLPGSAVRVVYANDTLLVGAFYRAHYPDVTDLYLRVRPLSAAPRKPVRSATSAVVFPNPCNGRINLVLPSPGHVEIFDLLGRRVCAGPLVSSGVFTWPLTNISSGYYVYRITGISIPRPPIVTGTFRVLN